MLNADGDDGSGGQLALKLPDNSRAVPILDEILARRSADRRVGSRLGDVGEQLLDRRADLVEVDQERVVPVR